MTITIDGTVSRSLPSSGGKTTLEVRIDPVAKTKATTRHVVLLVDTSGSMSGQKIENARRGVTEALGTLSDSDLVSVVGFDGSPEIIFPVSRWEKTNEEAAKQRLEDVETGGGTDIYKALERARDQLLNEMPHNTHAVKRIVLLSDGQDRYNPSTYRDLAAEFNEDGVSIVAAGIGSEYDEAVLLALANASGGEAADLSEEDISEFLTATVSNTEKVMQSNPRLNIELAQGFMFNSDQVYFDAPTVKQKTVDTDTSSLTVGLPELQIGKPHRLTVELLGQPKPVGMSYKLAELRVVDQNASVIADARVEVEYVNQAVVTHPAVTKHRAAAEITTDIQNPDIPNKKVADTIDKLDTKGWTQTAQDLRAKLNTADKAGGIIQISESRLDDAQGN